MITTLKKLITTQLHVKAHTPEFNGVYISCIRHLLWDLGCAEFHRELEKFISFKDLAITPKDFRMRLRDNGYSHTSIKYLLVALLKTNLKLNAKRLRKRFSRYDVKLEDAEVLKNVFIGNQELHSRLLRTERMSNIDPTIVTSKSYRKMRDTLSNMMPELEKYCKTQSSYRLEFITKYNGMSRTEFTSDLMINAISAYYRSMPNSKEYAYNLNYMRSSAKNRLVNIIDEYTRDCRKRLVNEGTDNGANAKFVLFASNESQLHVETLEAGFESDFSSYASIQKGIEHDAIHDFKYSAMQLCRQTKPRSKRRAIYYILTHYSRQFEQWLEDNKYIRSKNKTAHDYLVEKPRLQVAQTISKYVNVTCESVIACMDELAKHLAPQVGEL